jgi:hypothetical protein
MRSRVIPFPPALTLFLAVMACGGDVRPRRTSLTLGAPALSVGVLQGAREEMFGEIGDVVASPNGEFFVLDAQTQEINRYDSSGILRERVGRPGSGPGEFRAAADLAVTPDGYLVVVDEATRELSVYRVRPDRLEYAHKHQLPFLPRQVCQAAGRLFVLGLHNSFALHEVTLAGRVRNSFASVPGVVDPAIVGPDQELLREMYAVGQLACLGGRSPMVAYVPETFPVIRAFSADGRALWQAEIDQYHEFRRSQDAQGLVRFRPDPEIMRTHHATGLSAIDESAFVLQLTERDYEREEVVGLRSRLVSAANGQTISMADNLPRLSEAAGGRVYAWRSDPYPQVLVFALPPISDQPAAQ